MESETSSKATLEEKKMRATTISPSKLTTQRAAEYTDLEEDDDNEEEVVVFGAPMPTATSLPNGVMTPVAMTAPATELDTISLADTSISKKALQNTAGTSDLPGTICNFGKKDKDTHLSLLTLPIS